MFGGTVTKMCVMKVKSGADFTPSALNWGSATYDGFGSYGYTTQQINGINQTITISVNLQQTLSNARVCYKVDSSSPSYSSSVSPATYGFTDIQSTASISVSNGQYLTFSGRWAAGFFGNEYGSALVNNTSDSNVLLDTFNYDIANLP
jgi:hypothetical protein